MSESHPPALGSLNHLTLSVRDLARSERFYVDLLGMQLLVRWPRGRYLRSGQTWVCLTLDHRRGGEPAAEYTHLAFSPARPEDFDPLVARLEAAGVRSWQDDSSEGASHYFLDPDGHKLELHTTGLRDRLRHVRAVGGEGLSLHGEAAWPAEADLDDEALLAGFEAAALQPCTFTHTAHLRVAWIYLERLGFEGAVAAMRQGIPALNAAHGLVEELTRGYHDTLTLTWLTLVSATRRVHGAGSDSAAFVAAHPQLRSSKLPRLYYSKQRLVTEAAKARFVSPDVAPLPQP